MKTCLRLTFFACLLLPTLAAAEQPVPVPYSCGAGSEFTIRIPVRFPADMTVKYEWYRNDTAVTATTTLEAGKRIVAYTIPATAAFGDSVVYSFKYIVYEDGGDDCGEWAESRKYAVRFTSLLACRLSEAGGIEGDEVEEPNIVLACQLSTTGGIEGNEVIVPNVVLCGLSTTGSIEGE